MSQYAITRNPSQEDQQVSEQVAQQLQPLLEVLDAYVDCRLVETFWRTMIAIIMARTSLLLSVLGEYLADPQHGPAGTKQLSRLLHSAKWCSGLIERFLWQQAEQGRRRVGSGRRRAIMRMGWQCAGETGE